VTASADPYISGGQLALWAAALCQRHISRLDESAGAFDLRGRVWHFTHDILRAQPASIGDEMIA